MPRRKQNISATDKNKQNEQKLRIKLASLKTDFEAGKIESFLQIEALIPYSVLSRKVNMGYESFKNKANSPGDFSNNELIRLAELINIDMNLMLKFIFSAMRFKNKFKEGPSIRI